MKNTAPRTGRRGLAAAVATALSATLLLATPGATSAAGEPDSPDLAALGWTTLTAESKVLAPGVELFRYQEAAPNAHRAHPRELSIVRMDPAKGALRLESTYGLKAGVSETVRTMLDKLPNDPIAGANGSYFANEGTPGVTPDTIQTFGIAARDGELTGANCTTDIANPRNGVVLQYGMPYFAPLEAVITVSSNVDEAKRPYGEETQRIDDVNRNPGGALGCSRDADDKAGKVGPYLDGHNKSISAFTDPTEFVLFNDTYKVPTPKRDVNKHIAADDQPGYEVRLDAAGKIIEGSAERGGRTVNRGEYILQAIGDHQADWLAQQHKAGATLTVTQKVLDHSFDEKGVTREIPLDESVDILSGGARLVEGGENIYAAKKGTVEYAWGSCARLYDVNGKDKEVATFAERAATDFCRDSRTVLGVDDQGRTLIATLTGPRGAYAPDGGFLPEIAVPLKSFGVMDAVNLDGGGSTTLLTDSDRTREGAPADWTRQNGLTDGPAPGTERDVNDAVYIGDGGYPQ
ncbi:phosphodiester glycosidase family protein [Streptomyces sp. NPDC002073]